MNIRNLRVVPVLLSSLFLFSCATSFDVGTDYDEQYEFTQVNTFALVTPADIDTMVDDLAQARVESAVTEQLEARGFRSTSPDQADIIVSYFGTSEEGTDIQTYQSYNNHYGYGSCYRCFYPVAQTSQTEIRTVEYTQGMLMLDFVDPDTNTLKWRGQTSARFSTREANNMTVDEREELIQGAVEAILNEFPPGYEPAG